MLPITPYSRVAQTEGRPSAKLNGLKSVQLMLSEGIEPPVTARVA